LVIRHRARYRERWLKLKEAFANWYHYITVVLRLKNGIKACFNKFLTFSKQFDKTGRDIRIKIKNFGKAQ